MIVKQLSYDEYTYLKKILNQHNKEEYDHCNQKNMDSIKGIAEKLDITLSEIKEENY